jgi:hypothetical protein
MKKNKITFLLLSGVITSLFMGNPASAQDLQIYKHPKLNIQFEAPVNWKQYPYHKDKSIYDIFDPDTNIHVMLWYTTTEQEASNYLAKMADMKGFNPEEKPVKILIKDRDTWIYNVPGLVNKNSSQVLLAVIPIGKSEKYPRENVLYIVQIWCPEENYKQHTLIMENILKSVKVINSQKTPLDL